MFYITLSSIFFQIGLLTIGGGYAMLPLIQRQIVNHGWLTAREFVDIVAIAEMTPGAIVINAATFIGYRLDGVPGSLVATTAIALPSLLIIILLSRFLEQFENHPTVKGVFYGVRPAVAGLVASAAIYITRTALVDPATPSGSTIMQTLASTDLRLVLIAIVIFISLQKTKIHPILSICLAGFLGIILL